MNEKELLCRMALPLLPGIGLVGARHLIQAAGSATMLFEHARELPALLVLDKDGRVLTASRCPETDAVAIEAVRKAAAAAKPARMALSGVLVSMRLPCSQTSASQRPG